jgi:hypothetical protein
VRSRWPARHWMGESAQASDGPERVGRGHACGANHREEAGDGADEQREQDRFREELVADLYFGRAECPAQPDLGASLEHPDQHDGRDANSADQKRDGTDRAATAEIVS